MLNTTVLVITILAQTGPRYSVFGRDDEAVVYIYQANADSNGETSSLPVTASFNAFVDYEKAAHKQDRRFCDDMERRGDLFWVGSGTICKVEQMSGMSVGPIIRQAYKIRLLNGPHQGRNGWIEAKHVRKRSRIVVEPPEPITDEKRNSPRSLALAFRAQDQVVFRELIAAQDEAKSAAQIMPTRDLQRQARSRIFRRGLESVLIRYDLDEATAFRILDWGKAGDWPVENSRDPAKGHR
jgi:hypothetical protein